MNRRPRPHPEWVLMADRGVPIEIIARLNKTTPRHVREYVTRRGEALRGGPTPPRLVLHDRPRPASIPDPDRRWRARLVELEAFLATQQRRPHISHQAPERTRGTEWALAHWLTTQQTAERRGTHAQHRARALDRVLPSWRVDNRTIENEARWRLRLAELVTFVAQTGRFPQRQDRLRHSELATWFAAQQRAARQGTMDQNREH